MLFRSKGDYDANANGVIDAGESHPELARKADFLGINYYRPGRATGLTQPLSKQIPLYDFVPTVSYTRKTCPTTCTDLGWEIYPAGMGDVIREAGRYKLPLYVTENGIADAKDRKRAKFISDHVRAMRKAIKAGANVRGYFYWSLEDNLEWSGGYAPQFGLFTKSRRMRKSAEVFASLRPKDPPGRRYLCRPARSSRSGSSRGTAGGSPLRSRTNPCLRSPS